MTTTIKSFKGFDKDLKCRLVRWHSNVKLPAEFV